MQEDHSRTLCRVEADCPVRLEKDGLANPTDHTNRSMHTRRHFPSGEAGMGILKLIAVQSHEGKKAMFGQLLSHAIYVLHLVDTVRENRLEI